MQLTRTERQILAELVDSIRRDFGASEILLYGSAARGELQEGSDIDLMVVLPEVNWDIEKRLASRCFQSELRCGRVISTVCFTREELDHSPLRVSPLVLRVRKEGIPL